MICAGKQSRLDEGRELELHAAGSAVRSVLIQLIRKGGFQNGG
jgi:hypothetical protein